MRPWWHRSDLVPWLGGGVTLSVLRSRLLGTMSANRLASPSGPLPGSIVVMHMNHPRFRTAEALPEIVSGLRARGFERVTVGELLGIATRPR